VEVSSPEIGQNYNVKMDNSFFANVATSKFLGTRVTYQTSILEELRTK
jgi:hypothetical protein